MLQTTAENVKPDFAKLTRAEVETLFALDKAGRSQAQIAQEIGCSVPTVSRWLATRKDTRDEARQFLNRKALRLAKRIVAKADVKESLQVLSGIGVIEQQQASGGIQIMIGMPQSPAGPEPIFDISASLSPADTQDFHRLTEAKDARSV